MKYLPLLLTVSLLTACATGGTKSVVPTALHQRPLWEQAKYYAQRAEFAETKKTRLAAAQTGREVADACVAQHPSHPACYYYRAVLRGLYHQIKILKYQEGLKAMLADCRTMNALDPQFAGGGCYRIMGQIYTQVPHTAIHPDSITRDLERARGYLDQAIALAPDEAENHLALCELLMEQEEWVAADHACFVAGRLLRDYKGRPDYVTLRQSLHRAKKRLAKKRQGA